MLNQKNQPQETKQNTPAPLQGKTEAKTHPTVDVGVNPTVEAAKKAKTAKRKAQKEAKAAAGKILKGFIDKQADKQYEKALKVMFPSLYGIAKTGGGGGTSASERFVKFVAEKSKVKEDDIFREFKFGRKDCVGAIRSHLKKAEPADRLWISFNPENEEYVLNGKGATIPANWKGFIPTIESTEPPVKD
jgi:hypothetical protein